MTEIKGLIGSMSRKWKIDQSGSKKLEIENKLMEERLSQLKNDMNKEKEQRNIRGAASWSRGQTGPLTSYAKNVLQEHKANNNTNLLANKPPKLKLLKDEVIPMPPPKGHRDALNRDKTVKCGQCEKKFAFVHCAECSEDYCINCFSSFHAKGALRKHRSLPFTSEGRVKTPIIDVMPSPPTSANHRGKQPSYDSNNNSSRQSSSNISERNHTQKVRIQEQPKFFSARNGSAGSENSENQMYETGYVNYNSQRSSNYQDDDDDNDEGIGVGTAGGYGSLLDGNFDENESHEAFKRAVLEWRNGGNKSESDNHTANSNSNNNKNKNKKHIDVGTDNSEDHRKSSLEIAHDIEQQINFNHSLSYAERLLLKKYRRTDVEEFFNVNTNDYPGVDSIENTHTNTKLSVNVSIDKSVVRGQQHIDFNQLVQLLQSNNSSIDESDDKLEERYLKQLNTVRENSESNLKSSDNFNKTSFAIEEVATSMKSINLESMKSRQNTLMNEIMSKEAKQANELLLNLNDENKKTIKQQTQEKPQKTQNTSRPNSTVPNSSRQNSSRLNSARQNKNNSQKIQHESHLTQKPSDLLKSIANRDLPINTINNANPNGLGDYFLLSVENDSENNENKKSSESTLRPTSAINTNQKISYKLYEMSPRSWRPTSSLANNNNNNNNNQSLKIDIKNNNEGNNNKNAESNLKIMHASIESNDSTSTIRNSLTNEKQSNNRENSKSNNFVNNSNRQSTSSSLTVVSKDYEATMRNSSSANKNINNNSNNKNISSNDAKKVAENVGRTTPLKNINNKIEPKNIVKKVENKNDIIDFKLSKGLQWKTNSSLVSSTHSMKASANQKIKSSIKGNSNVNSARSRPVSVLSRCETPSNPQNTEFAEEYSTYDDDDGRSSRIFQNEDDDEYFKQLGREFAATGNVSFNAPNDNQLNIDNNNLMKLLSKKQLTEADLNELFIANIENGPYEEDDSDLDLEDLKSLK